MRKALSISSIVPALGALSGLLAQQIASEDKDFIQKAHKGGQREVQMGKLGVEKASNPAIKSYAQQLMDDHKKANEKLMSLAQRKNVTLSSDSGAWGKDAGAHHSQSGQSGSTTVAGAQRSGSSATQSTGNAQTQQSTGSQRSTQGADAQPSHGAAGSAGSSVGSHGDAGFNSLKDKSGSEFDREYVRMAIAHHEKDIEEFEKQAKSGSDADVKAFANETLPTLRAHLRLAQSLK